MAANSDAHVYHASGLDVNNEDGCTQCQDKPVIVIDELLCFITNKMNYLTTETIIQLCTKFYSSDDIFS